MKQKIIAFLFATLISIISIYGQESDPVKEVEIQEYFWKNPSKEFTISAIPNKWSSESAVIIAKQIEFKVSNVGFSEKLSDQYYYHERIKLLDANAVQNYSEFTFGDNRKYSTGLFSKASVNIYMGIKIEKPDGKVEVIDMKEVVKNEVENGKQKYSIRKIAVPNLQVGDIIDYYFYREHNFRDNNFHEFPPRAIDLYDKYATLHQRIKLDLKKDCYLNTKSINGAPQLKQIAGGTSNQYELTDSLREKEPEKRWINEVMQLPIVKLQVIYLADPMFLTPGYQSFFGPFVNVKNYVNVNELSKLSQNYKNVMLPSQGSMLASAIRPAIQYLDKLDQQKPLSDSALINEAFYFVREYWYQQRFYAHPQNYTMATNAPEDFEMTILLSNILSKLKREHEIIFVPTTNYTRDSDLLFINELLPGIKSIGDHSTIILGSSALTRANELPSTTSGVNGYSFKVSKSVAKGFERFQLPTALATDNQTNITSEISYNKQISDSVTIKSHFIITGSEKAGWDSVLFSPRIIVKEFDRTKYGEFIKESNSAIIMPSYGKLHQSDSLAINADEQSQMERIKHKLQEYYNLNDIEIKSFNIAQYGRFNNQPSLIFDITFTSGSLMTNSGDYTMIALGKLLNHKEKITEQERNYDIYFPHPYIISNQIILNEANGIKQEHLDQWTNVLTSSSLNFKTQASLSNNKLTISTVEMAPSAIVPKIEWHELISVYNAMAEFNNKKIIINDK